MARKRKPRVRVRDVLANANAKINQAGGTLSGIDKLVLIAESFVENADDFVDELADGVSFTVARNGEGTLIDFFNGTIDELPLAVRIKFKEAGDGET